MRTHLIALTVGLALVSASPVWAHSPEFFDSRPSAHGGQTRMAGPYHIELVTTEGEIAIHVTDHIERPISTEGGEAKAVVKNGKTRTEIALTPAEKNVMAGNGNFVLDKNTEVIVFVKLPENEAWAATFTPLKPKAEAAKHDMKGHDHHDQDGGDGHSPDHNMH